VKVRFLATAFLAATATAGCGREPVAPADADFLLASVAGSVQAEYSGSGAFRVAPASVPSPLRFSLFSRGTGASLNQSFHFVGRDAPGVGEYALQDLPLRADRGFSPELLGEGAYLGAYSHREGSVLRIFRATSGSVRVTESRTDVAPRRIAGTFTMVGVLSSLCSVSPGFPWDMIECEYVDGGEGVEVAGSFAVGPLGGDDPGLTPYRR
jgi:hypothetical protein